VKLRKSVWHTSNIDATTRPAGVSTAAKRQVCSLGVHRKQRASRRLACLDTPWSQTYTARLALACLAV